MKLLLTTIAAVLLVGCGPPPKDIWEAAEEGNVEAVKQHLAAGTDVNANDKWGLYKGETSLDWAIGLLQTETADLLRKHGGKTGAELKAEQN
jgi:ankyrin repeat protein